MPSLNSHDSFKLKVQVELLKINNEVTDISTGFLKSKVKRNLTAAEVEVKAFSTIRENLLLSST